MPSEMEKIISKNTGISNWTFATGCTLFIETSLFAVQFISQYPEAFMKVHSVRYNTIVLHKLFFFKFIYVIYFYERYKFNDDVISAFDCHFAIQFSVRMTSSGRTTVSRVEMNWTV